MIFTPGKKVCVSYSTGIMEPFTEVLTIKKYENNLLYFNEKSAYYAVECHNQSFYGYSYTDAGKVFVTERKWQLPFAMAFKTLNIKLPVKAYQPMQPQGFPMQLSKM